MDRLDLLLTMAQVSPFGYERMWETSAWTREGGQILARHPTNTAVRFPTAQTRRSLTERQVCKFRMPSHRARKSAARNVVCMDQCPICIEELGNEARVARCNSCDKDYHLTCFS
jgi:hypothetical protein